MARMLLYRRYWDRVNERIRRRNPGVQATWNMRLPPPQFIDYWPDLLATLPEKMVFSALIRRRINFYFSWYWGDFPFTEDKEERYRPDFILPDYNIIIEVYGLYWHTRPGMFEYDRQRTELFIAAGWDVYTLIDIDILNDVDSALDEIPGLETAALQGNNFIVGERPFDPTAAITGRMRRYPKVHTERWRDRFRGVDPGVQTSWQSAREYVRRQPDPPDPIFTPDLLGEDRVAELKQYGEDWQDWFESIEDYFTEFPEAKEAYPELWTFYNQWKGWWDRFSLEPV